MARKQPAWQRMVAEGYAADRQEAERWILSGKVRAGDVPVVTAGQPLLLTDTLTVQGFGARYVAKGGLKLEGAIQAFNICVEGRVCIDAGASTGGFTDCLVKHGASRVYAVDVGYGQLAGSLRNHPAVTNMERMNIGDPSLLTLDPCPTLGSVDLSYLSLRKAIPAFAQVMRTQGELLCLVKPLFEVDDAHARRTGLLSEDAYAPLLTSLCQDIDTMGHGICGVTHSPVTGNAGTREFFLHVALSTPGILSGQARTEAIAEAVTQAGALLRYHKER